MGRVTLTPILDIVFPIECLGCKQEGKWICEECAKNIPINNEPYCLECKSKTLIGEFCEKCKNNYSLDGVFIASDYDDKIVKKAITTLKYRFIYDISQELAKLLILFLENTNALNNFSKITIIPVPLHQKRLKWRGFNQAEKLAQHLVNHFNLIINTKDLVRVKHTKAQAKLKENERRKNMQNSFIWQGEDLTGQSIILIDDVVTTGSTMEECAKVLKLTGAENIWGAVVAKG